MTEIPFSRKFFWRKKNWKILESVKIWIPGDGYFTMKNESFFRFSVKIWQKTEKNLIFMPKDPSSGFQILTDSSFFQFFSVKKKSRKNRRENKSKFPWKLNFRQNFRILTENFDGNFWRNPIRKKRLVFCPSNEMQSD